MSKSVEYAVAVVWEKVYAQQDITSSIKCLEEISREEAEKVREEIAEYCFSLAD